MLQRGTVSESITPLFYLTTVSMNFLGATSCPDLSKTQLALTNYFSASSSESYNCVKGENPACTITEVRYFHLALSANFHTHKRSVYAQQSRLVYHP